MKIAFIENPTPWLVRQHVQVGLGILYLATILEKHHEVRVVRLDKNEDILKLKEYDIFCFTGTTLDYPIIYDIAKLMFCKMRGKKVFYGGNHATAMWRELQHVIYFDAICVGEGESLILQMVEDVKKNKLQRVYKADELIKDIDTIPFPDRSLIEGSHGGDVFAYGKNYTGKGNENFITSRGCLFNCAFCASEVMWHKKTRFRSVKNIVTELEEIIDKYNTKQLRICDDNLTTNRKRCIELCKEIEKFSIAWRCSVRVESLTPEICEAIAKAGCKEVSIGIESGDQRVLEFLNKKNSPKKVKEGCKTAHEAGIGVRALFMIGTPGERKDTPEINKKYLEDLAYNILTLATFLPLPATQIWNNPKKYNCEIISKDFKLYNKDFYTSEGKRIYKPLIRNLFLTEEQQIDNVNRMEKFVIETDKINKG